MKRSLTIKSRLFFAVAAILACSYALLFVISIKTLQLFIEDQTAKDLEYSLKIAKNQLNSRQELVIEALKLPAANLSVQKLFLSADYEELKSYAKLWSKSLDFLEIVTIIDSNNNVLARSNGEREPQLFLKTKPLQTFFRRKQPIATTELVRQDEYCHEVSHEVCQALPPNSEVMVQIVFVPIIDTAGNVIGAIITGDEVNREPYLPFQQQKVFDKTVEMLVTQRGELIASTMKAVGGLKVNLDARIYQSLRNGYSFKGTAPLNGSQYEMIAEPIYNHTGEFIGSIAVALGAGRFASIMNENYRNLMICGALSSVLIFILAYFITMHFSVPIRRFTEGIKAVESGDYTVKIPESGSLELKPLAETFNRMTSSLSERDTLLVSHNSQLRALNEELENRETERDSLLAAETAAYKSIIKSLIDGLVVVNDQQIIIDINQAAEKMFGVEASGIVGKPFSMLYEQHGLRELEGLIKSKRGDDLAEGKPEILLKHNHRQLRFTVTGLSEDSESSRAFWLGVRDVTTDGEVDGLKRGFIAKVSHELKTPLTSMKGSLQFILKKGKWLTGVEREMLNVCFRNTERLIGLVTGMIELSKIEARQIAFTLKPVQIGEVVLYALEENKGAALERNISIVNDVPMDLPKVYGDYERLIQVLSNLLSNAVKFSPQNSVVNVGATVEKLFITIFVADDGDVIPEEKRGALFSKFQQMGRPEEGEFSGSGLGLAICREILERQGGSIFYEPGMGKGNVFAFRVPLNGEHDGKEQDYYS